MQLIKEIRLSRIENRVVRSTPTKLPNGDIQWDEVKQNVNIGTLGIIRTNTYCKDFDHILTLAEEAKKDFPGLQNQEIQIVIYGGDRYRKTLGIEFCLPDMTTAPSGYTPIHQVEQTLA